MMQQAEMEEDENENQFYYELQLAKESIDFKQAARPSLYNVIKNLREDTVSLIDN